MFLEHNSELCLLTRRGSEIVERATLSTGAHYQVLTPAQLAQSAPKTATERAGHGQSHPEGYSARSTISRRNLFIYLEMERLLLFRNGADREPYATVGVIYEGSTIINL